MEQQSKPKTVIISNCSWVEIRGKDVKLIERGECRVFKESDSLHIHIGQVKYILNPGMPVVLQNSDDRVVFVFASEEEGMMFGFEASVSEDIQTLKLLLNDHMWQEKLKTDTPKAVLYGDKLTSMISSFGKHGVSAISRATDITKMGIDFLTEKSKQNISKAQSSVEVSEEVKANVARAQSASGIAVRVSSAVLTEGIAAAKTMSEQMKPVVNDYMKKKGLASDKPAGPKTKAAITVGKQTVKSGLEIYIAMKDAAKAVLFHAFDATTEMVDHRYGNAAGIVAKDLSKTVKNTVELTSNCSQLGITKTAKNVVIGNFVDEPSNTTHEVHSEVKEDSSEQGNLPKGIVYDLD